MNAGRRIGRTGPARDEADARTPGRLADRLRHHRRATLLTAYGDGDIAIMEGVEHGEITFARHTEHVPHAVADQLIDQNFGGSTDLLDGVHGLTRDGRSY